MKKGILIIAACILLGMLPYLSSSYFKAASESNHDRSIATDSASIALGQSTFAENCSACHNFRNDGIGPQLGGITAAVSVDWIKSFIKNPESVIESGDERALHLYEKYKTIMPSFAGYSDEQLNSIVAFLHTQKETRKKKPDHPDALKNPIPEPIAMSDLVVDLELVTQIPASSNEGQLTRICKLEVQPGTNALFVVDLRGKLYQLQGRAPKLYMDMTELRPKFIHKPGLATGFGSFAFHPEFQQNGLLYTTHAEGPGSGKADFSYDDSIKVTLQWVLTEWKAEQPGAFPFSGKGRELFRINMVHSFHGVQEITFNPLAKPGDEDYGLLYIGIGDGSSVEFGYPSLVHSIQKIWGTIIRIDPAGKNSTNGQYGIPESNPFAKSDDPNTVREIYAYGFRNPHRISWSRSGLMLASNIGHHNIEALNIILPGHDYGWHIREGTFVMDAYANMSNVLPLPPDDAEYNITYPVAQYDHDEGNAISGGYEYWGSVIPELKGKYLFGDIVKGRLFYVEMKDLKSGSQAVIREWKITLNGAPKTLTELCGAKKVDVRFGRDHEGEMYVMTKPDGKVYKLKRAGLTGVVN
jgi:glucose/arabinose dehydrogenase/mono/diheme cytochrome c family protein